MNKSLALSVALLALTPWLARAQTINGVVVEEASHMRVSGASVTVLRVAGSEGGGGGGGGTVNTDSTGAFLVPLGAPGRFVLRVTHPSYKTVDSDTVDVGEDEVVTLELRLGRNAIPLKPLVVTARVDKDLKAFHERAARRGFGSFLTREEIDRRHPVHATDLLQMMPGVQVLAVPPCRGCMAENVIYMRGGADRCVAQVLVDGMPMKQDATFPLDALLQSDMLEGVEVYSNEATIPPALMRGGGSCGLVAFWTRRDEGKKLTWKRVGVAAAIAGIMFLLLR